MGYIFPVISDPRGTWWDKWKVHFCPGFDAPGACLEHQDRGKTGRTLTWIRNEAFCQLWNQVQHGGLLLMLWLMITLFRIKTHAHFHALLFTGPVFLCVYTHTFSSLLCDYRDFHAICIKEIVSWFLWCPRNPQRLWRVFVQECEMSKVSHEPWPDFLLFSLIRTHCWEPSWLAQPWEAAGFWRGCATPFPPSPWSPSIVATSLANFCPSVGAAQPWFHWEKGICQKQEHFVSQPGRMSPLFGHEESSEPGVLHPGVWKSTRCSQCTPCLGTPCLCEQKERWQTSCLKRNPTSIINEGVPMEKNIFLISLLDVSKALVIAVAEFQIVCFSLSGSRWVFCWFSVTRCHPLISLLSCVPSHAPCSAASLPWLPAFFYTEQIWLLYT